MAKQPNVPIQAVDKPIICPPFVEPEKHWLYDKQTGAASIYPERRKAGYFYKTDKTGSAQQELFAEEEWSDLPLVNALREDVKRWRKVGYRGASKITHELLKYWSREDRPRPLFFCQRESVETIIYLAEIRLMKRSSRTGFQKFEVSDDDLARMLKGEKPSFNLGTTDFYPTLADKPAKGKLIPLRRMGCKMATGSGKTVVMAMLISWAFCNRATNPASSEFPHGVLVCCPNLTVKERLQVLRPESPGNYYAEFDLVPSHLRPLLQTGKVLVQNWHQFAPESEHREGDRSYAVVNKGPETPETLARRVLKDLYDRLPILVLNDEGHHCWRPAPATGKDLTKDEKKEFEQEVSEARVWLEGLDYINNTSVVGDRGVSFCVDLSATPFYIKGSGHPEGRPFPWLVSDFGLVDAIESGIVKIPRLPVRDDANKKDEVGRPDPKYFRLWHRITTSVKPAERLPNGKPKAEIVYREAEGAIRQIAGQWLERYKQIQEANPNQQRIPPVLIFVCDNTDIADFVYRKLSGESEVESVTQEDVEDFDVEEAEVEEIQPKGRGKKSKLKTIYGGSAILAEFSNAATQKRTVRIDSKLLSEAESDDPGKTRQAAAEELRKVIATVGKPGQPGEWVRCVVSVAMLNEGWDANNVTQIIGLRAFGSQLLCEQVVGRGLRRIDYEPDKETGLLREEYVDVYGIPFSVIPYKGRAVDQTAPEDKPKNRVWAVPDRQNMEIRFPIVEAYMSYLKKNVICCNVDQVEPLTIHPSMEPTATFLQPTVGYLDAAVGKTVPLQFVEQDRSAYYKQTHIHAIVFQISKIIVDELLAPTTHRNDRTHRVMRLQSRHMLFPQVYSIVKAYVERRVRLNNVDPCELGLEKYTRLVVERLRDSIVPDEKAGESRLVAILNRYRPLGSTASIDFPTTRPVRPTTKSHINAVVQHSGWEGKAAEILESHDAVKFYARNDHLNLVIPYVYLDVEHNYEPDFIVQLQNDVKLLLEIKGFEIHNPEQINSKHNAAKRWVMAVNNLRDEAVGRWDFLVSRDLNTLSADLNRRLDLS